MHESPDIPPRFRKVNLRPDEAADYLGEVYGATTAKATLDRWRVSGGGPQFVKHGPKVLYPRAEIDAWVVRRLGGPRSSTSDGPTDGDRR